LRNCRRRGQFIARLLLLHEPSSLLLSFFFLDLPHVLLFHCLFTLLIDLILFKLCNPFECVHSFHVLLKPTLLLLSRLLRFNDSLGSQLLNFFMLYCPCLLMLRLNLVKNSLLLLFLQMSGECELSLSLSFINQLESILFLLVKVNRIVI
jgi:hypothetical protein